MLYEIFTFINVLMFIEIYWPVVKTRIDAAVALHRLLRSWKYVLMVNVVNAIIMFKQWWMTTPNIQPVVPLSEGRFLITNVLNSKRVQHVLTPCKKKPIAVVDENYDECFLDESAPFFEYKVEPFGPHTIGVKKTIEIHWNNDAVTRIEP